MVKIGCLRWTLFMIVGMFFLAGQTFALTQEYDECPVQFIGKVKKLSNGQAPSSSYAKIQVTLEVLQEIAGDVDSVESLSLLKHGPLRFIIDESYFISMRDGFVCRVLKL